jgi:cation diffusion facilitator family transporter
MAGSEEKIAVASLSVCSNTALVALKVVAGVLTGSVAILSEALHSGMDLLAALIARYSVKKSAQPADHEHMYGHGKFENLSGLVEGALIFAAAAWIIFEAVARLLSESRVEALGLGMAVMGISAVVNLAISQRLMRVAKKTESLALEADAYHLLTDVYTSVGVFVALGLIMITGWKQLDSLVALAVAAFIVRAAYDISRRAAEGLLDRSLPDHEISHVERVLKEHEDSYVNFHKFRARKVGPERQIDLHLTVPSGLSVKEGHDLVEHLETEIKKALPNTTIVIHIEPCDSDCGKCKMAHEAKVFDGGRSDSR